MTCDRSSQQDVVSIGGDELAKICRGCLTVFCKKCSLRVFWPDSAAKAQEIERDEGSRLFCRCRPYTKRFAHRLPKVRDAI